MQPFRHILLPFDGSLSSLRACDEAAEFAEGTGARLTLLQVLEPSPHLFPRDVTESGRVAMLRELEARAAVLRAHAGIVEARIDEGLPGERIVHWAKALSADSIVMGTHGRTGLSHAILGSVAERVIRESPVPVVILREHLFVNRREALERIAAQLKPLSLDSAAIVALSRGALPIARGLARLVAGTTLDLWLTTPLVLRDGKVIGAMGEDERVVLAPGVAVDRAEQSAACHAARIALREELEEIGACRSIGATRNRPIVAISDGFTSPTAAVVAAEALRLLEPASLALVTPVASREALAMVGRHFDSILCLKSTILGERLAWYREDDVPSSRQAHDLLVGDGAGASYSA